MFTNKTKQTNFPLGDTAQWRGISDLPIGDPHLENWLLNTGSLSERLQSHCADFSVKVLAQAPQLATAEEYAQLDVPPTLQSQNEWQVREVILFGDQQPWVFARSIIPQTLCEQDFANLGNKPLGQLIFNDNRFRRMPFQLICLQPSQTLIGQYQLTQAKQLWGRRSVFRFQQHSMMVAEIFLPQAPAYPELIHEQ